MHVIFTGFKIYYGRLIESWEDTDAFQDSGYDDVEEWLDDEDPDYKPYEWEDLRVGYHGKIKEWNPDRIGWIVDFERGAKGVWIEKSALKFADPLKTFEEWL